MMLVSSPATDKVEVSEVSVVASMGVQAALALLFVSAFAYVAKLSPASKYFEFGEQSNPNESLSDKGFAVQLTCIMLATVGYLTSLWAVSSALEG